MPTPPDLSESSDAPAARDTPPEPWSTEDLSVRIERLPAGHPSSRWDDDGARRPPEPSLKSLELPDDEPEGALEAGEPASDDHGDWRSENGLFLSAADNKRIETECDRIADEEKRLTPRLQEIETQDPTRHLAGLEHCLKGRNRIKEKVAERIDQMPGMTPADALGEIGDAIRYTFQYGERSYVEGVATDVSRIRSSGFELIRLKNLWSDEQYRGINSRWRDLGSGQLVEVQFHTHASFEAKQVTHKAYERLRSGLATDHEVDELQGFQRSVAARVAVPEGASKIAEYG